MAFDLEVSVKLAGFNPCGMHVGRAGQMQASQPWAALEQRCSLVIQLVSTSSHICPGCGPPFVSQPVCQSIKALSLQILFLFVTLCLRILCTEGDHLIT